MNLVKKPVAVIGLGYVGLPLAQLIISKGFNVIGIDNSVKVVNSLNSGYSHIEDVSNKELKKSIDQGALKIMGDFSSVGVCDVVIICVPTPLTAEQEPDLTYLSSAVFEIAKHVSPGTLISLESTVQPGATNDVVINPILNLSGHSREKLHFCFSPERIDPGNRQWKIEKVPKVVAGAGEIDAGIAYEFYSSIFSEVLISTDPLEAEMAKLLENTFRLVNISFINEFALFCNKLGLDVAKVIDLAKSKPFGFMPFLPGAGIGGHCIPIDPVYLSHSVRKYGMKLKLLDESLIINSKLTDLVVGKISEILNKQMSEVTIGIVGLAYKANISDTRESPALRILQKSRSLGMKVIWHDPIVRSWRGESSTDILDLIRQCDLLVLSNVHTSMDLLSLIQNLSIPVLDLTYSLMPGKFVHRL